MRLRVHTRLLDGSLVRAGAIVRESDLPKHLLRERYISYDLNPPPEEEEEVSRPFDPSSRFGRFGAGDQRSFDETGTSRSPSIAEQEDAHFAEQPDDSPLAGSFAADFDSVESAEEEADLGEGVFSSQRTTTNQFGVYPIPCKRARTRE